MTRLIRELVCLLWTLYRPAFCSSDYPDWNVNSHKSNLKSQLHKICTYNCEICDKNPIPCSSWWASELWSMSKSEKITNVKGLCHGSRVDHPKQQHWSVHSPIFFSCKLRLVRTRLCYFRHLPTYFFSNSPVTWRFTNVVFPTPPSPTSTNCNRITCWSINHYTFNHEALPCSAYVVTQNCQQVIRIHLLLQTHLSPV